jgi:glycosyltransferase involved in cell wall biosynthesis
MTSVCIVSQSLYEFDPRVRRKAEALVAAGYSVDALALRSPQASKHYILNGVNVRTISLPKKRGSLSRYAFEYVCFFLWAFVRVSLQMRQRRYAVVDVNTLPDFLIFAGALARWMGAKLVLDMHEITPEFYISKYGIAESSRAVRFLKWAEKVSFDFADHVIAINEPIRDLFVGRGLPRSKSTVIMNTADEARFVPTPSADAAAASAKFVMMYHGTLTRIYGLDIAIEAFALAHEAMPGAELWIVGFGPEESSLESLIQERGLTSKCRLVGRVPPASMSEWLNKCDAGILPMRRDIFLDFASPNKLAEYIVMGKVVVISRLRAVRHYFSEEALAFVEPNNPSDLAKQMVRLYRDRELRLRMAARAKEEYAPTRWEVMRHRYLNLIEGMLAPVEGAAEEPTMPDTPLLVPVEPVSVGSRRDPALEE